MKIQVIIPTAGIGARLESDLPKPLVQLCGKPICAYVLDAFEKSPEIDSVILVGHKEKLSELKEIIRQYGFKKVAKVVAGGKTRCESVSNGLGVLDQDTDVVMVHDGARPLVSLQTIKDVVALCQDWDAVVTAVAVKSTIKRVDKNNMLVEQTLNREGLWEIQTPQIFRVDVLVKAHKENKINSPTDDASMVEQMGIKVRIAPGDYRNIKITTQEDLEIAETFLKSRGLS